MKLKDILSKVVENKRNGQLNTCIKKNQLKKVGISKEDLFNINIDSIVKKELFKWKEVKNEIFKIKFKK